MVYLESGAGSVHSFVGFGGKDVLEEKGGEIPYVLHIDEGFTFQANRCQLEIPIWKAQLSLALPMPTSGSL